MDLKWLGLGLLAYWLYNHYGSTDLGGSLLGTMTGAAPPAHAPVAPQPTPPVVTPGAVVAAPPAPVDWTAQIAQCAARTPAGVWDGNAHFCNAAPGSTPVATDPATAAFVMAGALQQDAAAAGMDPNGTLNVDQWNWLLTHDTRYSHELSSDLSRVGVKRDAAGATPLYTALQFAQLHVQDKGLAGLGRTLNMRPVGQRWTM